MMVCRLKRVTLALLLIIAGLRIAHAQYRSLRLDVHGQLYLTSCSGQESLAPELPDQDVFTDPLLSRDHTTVGWLAGYAQDDTTLSGNHSLTGKLVLYRVNHLLRTFSTEQVFWSWRFASHDRDVAFCTGPTHGGAAVCELHRIASGKRLADWHPNSHTTPPAWATGLRF